jgi:hypothetical protein
MPVESTTCQDDQERRSGRLKPTTAAVSDCQHPQMADYVLNHEALEFAARAIERDDFRD